MAAPSSAHTSPSQIASSAPKIQPSIACGPPIALMISGMVMNGPTPIMSIMFSAVALRSESPRTSRGDAPATSAGVVGALFWFMSRADQIYVQTDSSGNARRQLAEESVTGVDVSSLPVFSAQHAALERRFAGVSRCKQRLEVVVPRGHEVHAALLHPSVEIAGRDLVGEAEE